MKKNGKYMLVVSALALGCICIAFYGCRKPVHYPPEIESVLQSAGKNRKELENVLRQYSRNPSDSLKLRAAEFLIANMPGKYSSFYDAPWNDVATVHQRWTSSSDKQMVLDKYRLDEPVRKDDVTHITAAYLINNIELAFKVWRESSWGKHIPFDVFCEEILPYRVGDEPLENWRGKVLAGFADLYKSFREDTTITSVEACCKVNDRLPRFKLDKDFPSMSYSQLMTSSRGMCDHMTSFAIFAMRGLGIPVTYDFLQMRPFDSRGHSWNSVRDNQGVYTSFMGAESNPGKSHLGTTMLRAKTYRLLFAKQQHVTLNKEDIPPLLHNINYMDDITDEYDPCIDMCLPVPENHLNQTGYAFLAILNETGNWSPVAWGTVDTDSIRFQSVKSGLYLPVYYQKRKQTPVGYPFRFENNSFHFFQPLSSHVMSFTSIAPVSFEWARGMKGGKFEVGNQSDFSDARTIHTIGTAGPGYHTVSVMPTSAYRYVRYVSPSGWRCNVSMLEFYDENRQKLQGAAVGTPGSSSNTTMSPDNAFDSNVDTFYEAESEPSWVGLDLEEPRRIAKIRYLSRTDGNGIYEGQVYELFYWNGNKWQSLGRKTADSHILQYETPANALLYLKNITKNRMYKTPFLMENGIQKWFPSY